MHANIDVNAVAPDGRTALHAACHDARIRTVRLLFEREDLDVNKTDSTGSTPLITACSAHAKVSEELYDIVTLLLMHADTNVNAATRDGLTALHIACERKNEKIVHSLLKHKSIDVDKTDNEGNTALMTACRQGCENLVRLIINLNKADINKTNKLDMTSFEIACSLYYADIACRLFDVAHIREEKLGKDVYDACSSKDILREYLTSVDYGTSTSQSTYATDTSRSTYYATSSYVCSAPYSGSYDTGSSCIIS